ncbi:hypothetical protein [Ligilactobacillus murinus]|uniref:hypothetical protein n=1 Tax=Ligilactobacillus murinus TaxID=1622 RepID=UPI0012E86D1A|nr:hypothetical protein [Ligilactobacillus murinus]
MKKIDDMRIIHWDSKARNCTNEPYHFGMTVGEYRKQVGVNVTISDEPIVKKSEQKIPYYKGLSGK